MKLYNFLYYHRKYTVYIPLFAYWIVLLYLTSFPTIGKLTHFTYEDKVEHFLAYGGLAVLLTLALNFQDKNKKIKKHYLSYTYIIIMLYGLFDELHQEFIPGRFGEFGDYLANLIGAFVGMTIVFFFLKRYTEEAEF